MKVSQFLGALFLSTAIASALAACGRQDKLSKIRPGQAQSESPVKDKAITTDEMTPASSANCSESFEGFDLAQDETEIKFEDLLDVKNLKLSKALDGKKVVFKLQNAVMSVNENLIENSGSLSNYILKGQFSLSGANLNSEVLCHNSRPSSAKLDSQAMSLQTQIDLDRKTVSNFLLMQIDIKENKVGTITQFKSDIESPADKIIPSTGASYQCDETQSCNETVLSRQGDDTLILRQINSKLVNGNKVITKILATFKAEAKQDSSSEADTNEISSLDELDETLPPESEDSQDF